MEVNSFSYRTPASMLVEVAKIASAYRGHPDRLNRVATEVKQLVPVLSYDVINVMSREMEIPVADIYNYVTFYAMLSTKPHGKYTIRMCKSAPCHVNGSAAVLRAVEEQLGIKAGETTEDGRFSIETCPCLGLCDVAPAIMINKRVYGDLTPERVRDVIKTYIREEVEP